MLRFFEGRGDAVCDRCHLGSPVMRTSDWDVARGILETAGWRVVPEWALCPTCRERGSPVLPIRGVLTRSDLAANGERGSPAPPSVRRVATPFPRR